MEGCRVREIGADSRQDRDEEDEDHEASRLQDARASRPRQSCGHQDR